MSGKNKPPPGGKGVECEPQSTRGDFAAGLEGVKPLSDRDKRARPTSSRVRPAAQRKKTRAPDLFEHPDPEQPRLAHRGSVSAAAFGRLVSGALAVDRKLDLHGMRAEAAHDALRRTLSACAKAGDVVLLLVHGRGKHTGGFAVLRDALPEWLEAENRVVAFAPARREADGAGATCVLLRAKPDPR